MCAGGRVSSESRSVSPAASSCPSLAAVGGAGAAAMLQLQPVPHPSAAGRKTTWASASVGYSDALQVVVRCVQLCCSLAPPLTPSSASFPARDDRSLPGGVFHHLQASEARPAWDRCHPLLQVHPTEINKSFGKKCVLCVNKEVPPSCFCSGGELRGSALCLWFLRGRAASGFPK